MNWTVVERCPICDCDLSLFFGQGNAPIFSNPDILGGGPLSIVTNYHQCVSCGLVRQSPRLDDASLLELYSSGKYRQMINNSQEAMDQDEKARGERIAALIVGEGRHLDIGCSRGYLLELSAGKGRQVLGVEPNLNYVRPGIPAVDQLSVVVPAWDTITCIATLEHVPDPVNYADQIMNLLAPDGRLIIEVPSEKSKGGPLRLWHLYLLQPWVIMRLFNRLTLVDFKMTPDYLFVLEKHG